MPRVRIPAGAVNVVTVNETVVATLPGLSVPSQDPIDIEAYVDITTGVAATAVIVAIERGAAAGGAVVGSKVQATVVAGNRYVIPINASDLFQNDVSGQQYVLTVQQVAATGNGTVNSAYITALY